MWPHAFWVREGPEDSKAGLAASVSSSEQKTTDATIARTGMAVRKAAVMRDWQQLPSRRSFRFVPGGIRVIGGHRFCKLCCVGTVWSVALATSVSGGSTTNRMLLRQVKNFRM